MADEVKRKNTENDLWTQFEAKLTENETDFEDLDEETDWKMLLKEFGFTTLQAGQLLKQIKARKKTSSPGAADPVDAFKNLVSKESLTTKTVTFLWENEADMLKMAAMGILSKDRAKQALIRAHSRIRSSTGKYLGAKGYLVGKVLYGSGKTSSVYKAFCGAQALVAKVYNNEVEGKEGYKREQDVFTKLGPHPAIVAPVKTKDLHGEHAGVLFFPRYIQSLSELILDMGPLCPSTVIGIAQDILSALQHLHKHSFVHCDVKPGNIVLNITGRALLIDLASAVPENAAVIEHTSHYNLGLHNAPASPALDLRCLAVTMFQSLTGRLPTSLDSLIGELKALNENEAAQLALQCAYAKSLSDVLQKQG